MKMTIEVPKGITQPDSFEVRKYEVIIEYGTRRVCVEDEGFQVDGTFVRFDEVLFYESIAKQIREGGLE